MKNIIELELKSNIRAKWFIAYCLVFASLLALFFITGLSSSAVLGFSGLSRVLLLYIQICIIILPIFILLNTVKGIVNERENTTLEYMLSYPISLKSFYFGKLIASFIIVFSPCFLAMLLAIFYALIFLAATLDVYIIFIYSLLIFSLCVFFICLSFLIAANIKSSNLALSLSFFIWILLVALLDMVFMGLMIEGGIDYRIIISLSLLNPLEDFRIAALALFNPSLSVLGQSAYFILDNFGKNLFLLFAILYPIILGIVLSIIGYKLFTKRDLL